MELVAAIDEPAVIDRILLHLGFPARAPPRGRPWQPQRVLPFDPRDGRFDGIDEPAVTE